MFKQLLMAARDAAPGAAPLNPLPVSEASGAAREF